MRHSLLKRFMFVLAGCGLVFVFSAGQSEAAINPMISFQGKLTNPDGTNVTDGTYSLRFRIYTDPTADTGACANTCKWEETQASVTVASGLFHVNLGSVTALPGSVDFNASALYLGVKVSTDAEMTPRVRLTAAPYAFNSDLLDGLDAGSFVQLSPGSQQTGNINVSGTITSGAINSQTISSAANFTGTLTVQGASSLTLGTASSNRGAVIFRNAAGANTVTLQAPTANPGSSFSLTLPSTLGSSGDCLKQNDVSGTLAFGSCSGSAVTLQNAYDNSSSPATITAADNKNLVVSLADTATDPNFLIDLLCDTSCTTNGRFAIQDDGSDVLTVAPAAGGITIGNSTLNTPVTINSGTGTVAIGTGAQARTVNIATGGATQTTTVGSTNGASSLDLQAGTGGVDITTQGTGALNVGNNAVAQTINIGNATGATSVSVLCGTGACGFGNNAVAHTTTLGSATGAATTLLQAGSGGLSLTSGANITLGTSDTTGTLLVLDTKTSAGDPTGVNGGMYYNSSSNTFRCYQNGAWKDCDTEYTTVKLTSDQSRTATTYANVTGLSFAVAASTDYDIECTLLYDTAAATTAAHFAVNGPASPTALTSTYHISTSTTADTVYSHTAYNNTSNLPTNSQGTVRTVGKLWAVLRNGATAGTFALRYKSEVNASAVNVRAGSYCQYRTF